MSDRLLALGLTLLAVIVFFAAVIGTFITRSMAFMLVMFFLGIVLIIAASYFAKTQHMITEKVTVEKPIQEEGKLEEYVPQKKRK